MPRRAKGLTAAFVEKVTKPGRYGDGDGLYLDVQSRHAKSYVKLCTREALHKPNRRQEAREGSRRCNRPQQGAISRRAYEECAMPTRRDGIGAFWTPGS
jgi:hypothetical protein